MTPGIYVGSRYVPQGIRNIGNLDNTANRPYQHLYLVYRDAQGNETVIRGGPDQQNQFSSQQGVFGGVRLQYGIPLASSLDAYLPGENASTRNERLLIGGSEAIAKWDQMLATANQMSTRIIASEQSGPSIAPYDFLGKNSKQ